MPIYEYYCKSCENRFEELVKETDDKVECLKCGSKDVEKLISCFSAKFSGGDGGTSSAGGGGCGPCSGSSCSSCG